MLALSGLASQMRGFDADKVRCVVRLRSPNSDELHPSDVALVNSASDVESALDKGFRAVAAIGGVPEDTPGPNVLPGLVCLPQQFDYLRAGDVIAIQPKDSRVRTLYRRNSAHNAFLVTERCNHYCLMCSQPPRRVNDGWIIDEIRTALPLISKETRCLGFTGGEPLTDWRDFLNVLHDCRVILPTTAVHVLSNGRAFVDNQITAAWAAIDHPDLMVGIPIYSAVDHIHDYVVQARGAFDETVLGVLKLKDKNQRVEIRVVLHAITAPRIVETCRWLARNLPFVDHVALMGLENTGFAIANDALLWIDPMDYREQLAVAVDILAAARVNVSVYNLPRCVLAHSVWSHAVQSISDWKNDYVDECNKCIEKDSCSGFFTTGRPKFSRGIQAIQ
jgi:His-Xaa-Ser system radical SAM maturase HxsC